MGVRECQSRFYENLIGRSRAFIGAIYPKGKNKTLGNRSGNSLL